MKINKGNVRTGLCILAFILVLVLSLIIPNTTQSANGDILGVIDSFLTSTRLYTIAGMIALDLMMGVAISLRLGEFDFAKLANYYGKDVIPYVIGYLSLHISFSLQGGLTEFVGTGLDSVAYATVISSLTGKITGKVLSLFPDSAGVMPIQMPVNAVESFAVPIAEPEPNFVQSSKPPAQVDIEKAQRVYPRGEPNIEYRRPGGDV